jgi:dolichol-phosphate mannosyltransferase
MIQLDIEDIQIVVIDDSSPDGTGKLVAKIAKEYPGKIHVIERSEKGRGTAGIAGFKYSLEQDVDYIIEMDADFSHDPKDISRMLKEIKVYDIIVGSRFLPGSKIGPRSLLRRLTIGAPVYIRG